MSTYEKANLLTVLSRGHERGGFTPLQFWIRVVQNSHFAGLISADTRRELAAAVINGEVKI